MKYSDVVQVVNFGNEDLVLPKNSLLGLAETFDQAPTGTSVTPIPTNSEDHEQSSCEVFTLNTSEKGCIDPLSCKDLSLCRDELNDEIQSKLSHLSNREKGIIEPILLKYKHLFSEPIVNTGCSVDIKH